MEETLTQQRAALVSTAHTLRAEHEDLAIHVEAQQAQVAELLTRAEHSVKDITDTAAASVEALTGIASAAASSARNVAETAQSERDLLSASALQSMGAVSEAARFEREAMLSEVEQVLQRVSEAAAREQAVIEEDSRTRLAALSEAARFAQEGARLKMEELREAAFEAGQQSENAFQSRLNDASDLIARSAGLVDQAAAKNAERIEQATAKARASVAEIEEALAAFEARAAKLPAETRARAEEMRQMLAGGIDDLLANARKAAEETQAIDAAFQDRVRRNYEMLSEAARLMGVVSGRPGASPAPPIPRPSPAAPVERPSAARASLPPLRTTTRPPETPPSEPPGPISPSAAAGLRPRLKLAPTAADTEVSSVFGGGAEPPAQEAGWSWRGLLSSMPDAPVEDGHLADRLIGEAEALGVDLAALLPPARLDEIAVVVRAGDLAGARAVVRHLSPAAVRRLSRRAVSDRSLREHAEHFVSRYAEAIEEAMNQPGGDVLALLDTDEGRTFLLFNAALGDLR